MKIIDAVWEKRNLGVSAIEIEFENDDVIKKCMDDFQKVSSDYIAVKVPTHLTDITDYVQKNGYSYVEDIIHVEHDLSPIKRSVVLQRLYDNTSYKIMDKNDISELFDEMKDNMFVTDRISNDSYFGQNQAADRYINWVKDLIDQNAYVYAITYKNENSGFVVLRKIDENSYASVLGAAYKKYRKTGLGIIQKEQEIVKNLGGKRVVTSVSSNNVGQLKALILNGYKPYSIEHVFIKHNN